MEQVSHYFSYLLDGRAPGMAQNCDDVDCFHRPSTHCPRQDSFVAALERLNRVSLVPEEGYAR